MSTRAAARPVIGWYVHHHGAGHLQRAQAVARLLHVPVTGLSSLPRPEGWVGDWVQLARDDDAGVVEHPAPHRVDAGGRLHWAPLHHAGLAARGAALASWVAAARPRLLVSDVSVEVTLLARLLGVPVVVAAMLGERHDAPHELGRDVATALLAPWPAPAGVAARPGTPVHHVGAFSRFDGRPTAPAPVPGRVLVLWGSGGSDVAARDFTAARAATPGWEWTYRVPGLDGARGDALRDDVWEQLQAAEVVVVHGGHNAVAEVAAARRAAVVVAQDRPFAEQQHRTALLRAEGLVALDRWPAAHEWPGLLERARTVGPHPWRRWAPGDGAARAAAVLDDLAGAVS